MNFIIETYEHAPGDFRRLVRAEKADIWLIAIDSGGSGYTMRHLKKGDIWPEGPCELHRIFDTWEEAEAEWNRL